MGDRSVIMKPVRLAVVVALVGALVVGCTHSTSNEESKGKTAHAQAVATLTGLLPADTRGVFAVDVASLLSSGSSKEISALLGGAGGDVAFKEVFGSVGTLATAVDVPRSMTSALLVQTTDTTDGLILMAKLRSGTISDVVAGSRPKSAGSYGSPSQKLYVDANGNHLALLPEGVLVVGKKAAVESVLDVADGAKPDQASAIVPFLDALDGGAQFNIVYGLPALFDHSVKADRSLRGAAVMSGALNVVGGDLVGSLAFHTSNASKFVHTYNTLNRNAVHGNTSEKALTLAKPVAKGLPQVVVTLPPSPINPTPEEAVASRNIFKKLFVGMQAYDYAAGVSSKGNPALIDLIIKSEADKDTPPSPGAVFFRWEFRDQAAIKAFEAEELPPGFHLAPTQFLASDDPKGGYFLALMLYNSGGGSIVDGARAEWDVFVSPPKGADPDAPNRPRYMLLDALSEKVSADPLHLLTKANPLSYEIVGSSVVSSVHRLDGDRDVPVFDATFAKPDPHTNKVATFTREMAIGNDYMHWSNGVYDRLLYNATTFNYDGYFVDPAQITVHDNSHWAQYLKPAVKDATYYVNTLEYVASPMANLYSTYLDVTPEWLAKLIAFKDNGHERGIMRAAVEKLFVGTGDAYVGSRVANTTPSTYYSFKITDPAGLEASLHLPAGQRLAKTKLLEGGPEEYYLTLSISKADDALEGTRAEWSVYVSDGDTRPHQLVLDLMTADVGINPVSILNLPTEVRHGLAGGTLSTQLSSAGISFDASFKTAGATDEVLPLDWTESGDNVCYTNGICDMFYYDAESMDVPVHRPATVTVNTLSTPWNAFLSTKPTTVFYRDNAQEFAVKRWANLEVPVEVAPVSGLAGRTHAISGTGKLVGRTSDVADSSYTYTGDAVVKGDKLTFSIDQRVKNTLGLSHIYTTGRFDLTTGKGTQSVVDCRGPSLMCGDIVAGSKAPYTAQDLDASDRNAITWKVDVPVDLGRSFGMADSASSFTATRKG